MKNMGIESGSEHNLSALSIDDLIRQTDYSVYTPDSISGYMHEDPEFALPALEAIRRDIDSEISSDTTPAKHKPIFVELLKRIDASIDERRAAAESPFVIEYENLDTTSKLREIVRIYKMNGVLSGFYDNTKNSQNPPTIRALKSELFDNKVRMTVLDRLLQSSGEQVEVPAFRSIQEQRDWLTAQDAKRGRKA